MEEPPPNKNNFLKVSAFWILFCAVLFSCAENKVEVVSATANVVFDFSENELPSQFLSVFIQVSSNVRRLEAINVRCDAYTWKIENPFLIQGGGKSWAGYVRLEPPSNLKKIPKGEYFFECIDAAGEKAEGTFVIDYDDELSAAEFSDETFSDGGWNKRLAVYSETAELLYFDEEKNNWSDDEQIFSAVKNSDFLRRVFESGSVMYFAPKAYKLTPERKRLLEQSQVVEQEEGEVADEQ